MNSKSNSRLGFLLAAACGKQSSLLHALFLSNQRRRFATARPDQDLFSFPALPTSNNAFPSLSRIFSTFLFSGRRAFCGYAAEQFSDDEYECDYDNHKASSSVANIDEWKWKLNLLLHNEKDQEIVSRDKRDRRDYEQISNLAKRMGLYCELYGKVVVASKVPLPNYRPDLDDKRPQREVVIPLSLQRRVEGLLQEHLDRMQLSSERVSGTSVDTKATDQVEDVNPDDDPDSFLDGSVMEKVLQRQSLRMRNMQRTWQESPEGRTMLDFRRSLPAFKEKERLLQAIAQNQVVVISGETGCGKTTQLPQYILESEIESGRGSFCNIICTQPRRISAMALPRMSVYERGEPLGESVGYKVRLEGMKGRNTHLLFCTSGILLRRLLSDRNLNGITHVFVDEIHERGMNEDFLLIVLKDLLPRRRDLRLILMSATLNAELFSNYFGGAPTIHIPGFTYPVKAHFLEDVLEMTGYKLTSFNQIDDYGQEKMWKTQRQLVPRKRKNQITALVEDALSKSNFENYSARARDSLSCWIPDCIGFNLIEASLCHICRKERPGAVLVFMTGWEDISCMRDQLKAHPLLGDPNRVLLLTCHGSMATSEQKLIFEKPPPNVRKIVLATNMAEASITINDVVFVIDCGKAKETTYDALNNTPCLLPSWISQASARQRRGRAGRVQPGECYHLYPQCVYEAFAEYQLPELLRTPLNSLCLQIKSLQVGSIGDFLSAALQPPESLAVQNAVDFLKMIGALDENENLTHLGGFLSMLPVDPKLGKMLIMGAIFSCFDPILTIVAGLSVRDPFLLPQDKKDLAGTAKSRFSAKDYSDHMALVRAYEGWKDAERGGSAYEYCWRNFLSAQTLQAIHSLRKQFSFILKGAGLLDADAGTNNRLSHNQSLVRAIICSGLFPGISSVVHRETSMSFKTMDDGQVLIYANSVNARYQTIPYPWLVFGEKVKVNTVFIRDSTGVSDSILILFGGNLNHGVLAGHLKMLEGYIEFFMDPSLLDCYVKLKEELDKLLQKKLQDPSLDIQKAGKYLMLAVQELVSGDQCEGRFVFGRESKKPKESSDSDRFTRDGTNPKSLLQTLMMRAGHSPPKYKTKHLKTNEFRALVEFKGMQFVGKPKKNKQLAERDAALEALAWLTQTSDKTNDEDDNSPPDVTDNMLKLLGKRRRSKRRSG
ncbi:DExH-box ATP-dependent RNA helicase DExH3 isoform X1 [Camellia sinensis]|uniref:DExH-box ATP-dependent RNA helicase DExH3 isoform X1 n=2 Tax=Camellia sinensis TaxID=4442 RepID=UPI0010355D32|nr:DExH-box ATP-dependent RNA helicase DExH3 isoform X1 [Camellia sinensis]